MTSIRPTLAALVCTALLVAGLGSPLEARAADLAGSRDHPIVNVRYPEAEIYGYKETEFDEYRLLLGAVPARGKLTRSQDLEGKITTIDYAIPKHRSTLEVMRNYEIALRELGFSELFACKNEECGGRPFNHAVVPYCCGFGDAYEDQRFYAGKLERAEGAVYVSLYIVKATNIGGPTKDRVNVRLVVIETKPMAVGMKIVTAEEMRTAIEREGRVAIHSILFAFDSAEIQPDSRPALDEIGKLLGSQPGLRLLIVGHTDNQGTLDYNLDLSRRRAQAVATDLASRYGVDSSRLSGHGVGFLAPIAPNSSEEGRALNRRVELVPR